MKHKLTLVLCLLSSALSLSAFAQGTAFTYQGRLNDGATTATGNYDLRFALFNAASAGTQQGSTLTNAATTVSNGLFTVMLDFGNQFSGANRWLEIGVRTNGGGSFTTLSPRQALTASPYALYAPNAGTAASAGSVAAANITGTLPLAQLPTSVLTNGASGVNISGTFSGNGAGVTNVDVRSLQQPVGIFATWGNNQYGQTNVPAGLSNVLAIAAGRFHNLALKSDRTVAAWGDNVYGQTNVPAGLGNVVAIAAGDYSSLALKSDGTVTTWGINASPVSLNNVVAVAGGTYHNLVLHNNGIAFGWGGDTRLDVPAGLSNVVAIAAGSSHSLALKSDGTVVAWGFNSNGQTNVPAGLSNVVAIAGGGRAQSRA